MKRSQLIRPLFLTGAILSGVVATSALYTLVSHAEEMPQTVTLDEELTQAKEIAQQAKPELEMAVEAQRAIQADTEVKTQVLNNQHTQVNNALQESEANVAEGVQQLGG